MTDKFDKWNYLISLGSQNEWWRYFGEYKQIVSLILERSKQSETTIIARPTLFLMRHTLELGFKANIVELEKESGLDLKLNFSGAAGHYLEALHEKFEMHFSELAKKYDLPKTILSQFKNLNEPLEELRNFFHRLDKGSYGFRYPFQKDGTTPSFARQETLEIKKIIVLYEASIDLLIYTTDVIAEYLPPVTK